MSGEFWFGADLKIDAADFQRQLDEARQTPIGDEVKAIITGTLDAQARVKEAKYRALLAARKKLVERIWTEYRQIVDAHFLPAGVSEDLQAWIDEGPLKVQP